MRRSILICFLAVAQQAVAQEVQMADQFRAEGKIYVVIAVIAVLLIGLFGYLFLMDRKLSKMEKDISKKPKP